MGIDKKRKTLLMALICLFVVVNFYSVFGMIQSTEYFYVGYHNLDNGQNMRFLEQVFDTELVDRFDYNELRTPEESYILGTKQLRFALDLMMISSLFYLTSIILIIHFSLALNSIKK